MINGAGIIAIAPTGRILLAKRSDTYDWCGIGGKIEIGESPIVAAKREFGEEVGYNGHMVLKPFYHFTSKYLDFVNFIGFFPYEFTPRINDEHIEAKWLGMKEILQMKDDLHFGFKAIIKDRGKDLYRITHRVQVKYT